MGVAEEIPTVSEFARRWAEAAGAGGDPARYGVDDRLGALSGSVVASLLGSERELAHLRAQIALESFADGAAVYLSSRRWRAALASVIREVAAAIVSAVLSSAARALVEALEED